MPGGGAESRPKKTNSPGKHRPCLGVVKCWRAPARREGEARRAQGLGSELTHADVSQLGRAQLHVPENRGQDGREELVGGGVLQREAWPR